MATGTGVSSWTLDHIGIAVSSLDDAISFYERTLGARLCLRETIEASGVELAFIDTGDSKVELLAATRSDSAISSFLASRGPGIHHICYRVSDIKGELARLKGEGFTLIDEAPRPGAAHSQIAFVSPRSFMGVLTELVQPRGGSTLGR